MVALELQDVHKSFGPVRAVDGLSAAVEAGCIYGFLGPTGRARHYAAMIVNILRPDHGTIPYSVTAGAADAQSDRLYAEERGSCTEK